MNPRVERLDRLIAFFAMSSMGPRQTRSRGDKQWLSAAQDLIANAGVEKL